MNHVLFLYAFFKCQLSRRVCDSLENERERETETGGLMDTYPGYLNDRRMENRLEKTKFLYVNQQFFKERECD